MTDESHEGPDAPAGGASRRRVLIQSAAGGAVLACGLAGCATMHTKVQGKTSKAEAGYQDRPRGLQRCGVCKHFIPLSGCEVVEAPVQANGWCGSYAFL